MIEKNIMDILSGEKAQKEIIKGVIKDLRVRKKERRKFNKQIKEFTKRICEFVIERDESLSNENILYWSKEDEELKCNEQELTFFIDYYLERGRNQNFDNTSFETITAEFQYDGYTFVASRMFGQGVSETIYLK